ncbi:LysM peptidoglycan-binding domain-containing protein [Staphylococcus caledonicus]|uniref:LysM peptidoglycan-binding domain-containing protein n=1 Tax=Staphylococcus caledonicus TaxID=2741333 RepID=UPI0018E4CCA8|nr:LysM peptidoglycan-binding domain-containing protein [Staphylococcus caledonicus]MBI5973902.1 LysM peptidoglycan-binding domain-containing protein [Staphylococcus caledonicus]
MVGRKQAFNKSFQIVRALENGLYKKYLDGDIVLQDIANEFGVTVQHVASIVKVNNIGNPNKEKSIYKSEEQKAIKRDIDNGLPIEYFKSNYKVLEKLSSTINVSNTFLRWKEKDGFHTDVPYATLSRLNKTIASINIRKYIEINNNLPKSNRESLTKIAKRFNVSYTKVANIATHLKKNTTNLIPSKDDKFSRIVYRNLNIVEEVTYSKTNHEEAIDKVSKKYKVDRDIIESILSCEAYVKGASLDEYLDSINNH